jgi:magnesium chelatase family protein
VRKYRGRVSGPLLDRIDLHVRVPPVDLARLTGDEPEENSEAVRARVEAAREVQQARSVPHEAASPWNASLGGKALRQTCKLPPGGRQLLAGALRRRGLSARAIHRVLRVARTIADLEGAERVMLTHLAGALRYRLLSETDHSSSIVGRG